MDVVTYLRIVTVSYTKAHISYPLQSFNAHVLGPLLLTCIDVHTSIITSGMKLLIHSKTARGSVIMSYHWNIYGYINRLNLLIVFYLTQKNKAQQFHVSIFYIL